MAEWEEELSPEWERILKQLREKLIQGGYSRLAAHRKARELVEAAIEAGVDPHAVDIQLITPEDAERDWYRYVVGAPARTVTEEEVELHRVEGDLFLVRQLIERLESRPDLQRNEGLLAALRSARNLERRLEARRDEILRRVQARRRRARRW
jgi:hypothetical protein